MYSAEAVKNAIQLIYYALIAYEVILFYIGLTKYGMNEYKGGDVLIDAFWLIMAANLPVIVKFIFF